MSPVFTDTWGGDSFELSVNFTYVGQSTSQQGQSSEAFKGFQQFTSAVSSELEFEHVVVGGQERSKESNSCSRTLLRTHPGPWVLCWPTAGSSWGEFGFNLQMTKIAILELILPVWEWKAAPVDKKDFHLTTWGRRQFRGAEGPWSLERVSAPASWVAGRLGGRELVMKRVNEEGN